MGKIIHFFVLSCFKATYLIEKGFHVKLTFIEKLQLKWHKKICDACLTYEKQSHLLNTELQNHFKQQEGEIIDVEQLKEKIISNIK